MLGGADEGRLKGPAWGGRRYTGSMVDLPHGLDLEPPFDEFRVWQQRIRPVLSDGGVEASCLSTLEYVCTEMLNNVLDHSQARQARLRMGWNPQVVALSLEDDGIGAFTALRSRLGLTDDVDAALLMLKGKATSDPEHHTGEGLFFSSRACEWFALQSGRIGLSRHRSQGWWGFETPNEQVAGTRLHFHVSRTHPVDLPELFERFCPHPELSFSRTEVSVGVLRQADGALVSRSQGKRLVAGLERFTSVVFDFAGVDAVQQGFADEVFRVWRKGHPQVHVDVLNAAEPVQRMLKHVGFAH